MNVVFIVLDTLRKDRLGVYNDAVEFTPNLDGFAADATVFEDAVAQAPWTLPSHASMFTGLYPWEHDATQKNLFLDTDTALLAERFRDAGYSTACYTSNTWISSYTGLTDGFEEVDNFFPILPSRFIPQPVVAVWKQLNTGRGKWLMDRLINVGDRFHEWFEGSGRSTKTEEAVEKAAQFMREEDEFFLFVNLMDAHEPYYPFEEYRERHAPDVDPEEVCQVPEDYYSGEEDADFDQIRKLYDAEVDYLDDSVGRLLDVLEEEALVEDTVVVVVSDHGQELGEGERYGHQFTVSEEVVAVPLLVRAPALPDTVEEQVELRQLYDLLPRLAGLEEEEPEVGTATYAKGGYAYPELNLRNLPEEKQALYGKELAFVRGDGTKVVREEDDDVVIWAEDLATRESVTPPEPFLAELDAIGHAEAGTTDVEDEEVRQRLEDLGYL